MYCYLGRLKDPSTQIGVEEVILHERSLEACDIKKKRQENNKLAKENKNRLRLTKRNNMPYWEGVSKDKFNGYLSLEETLQDKNKRQESHALVILRVL